MSLALAVLAARQTIRQALLEVHHVLGQSRALAVRGEQPQTRAQITTLLRLQARQTTLALSVAVAAGVVTTQSGRLVALLERQREMLQTVSLRAALLEVAKAVVAVAVIRYLRLAAMVEHLVLLARLAQKVQAAAAVVVDRPQATAAMAVTL